MEKIREAFLKEVKPGGQILDLGCGSGRDLKAFKDLGYPALGLDPSPSLAKEASLFAGAPVVCADVIEAFPFLKPFDGIFACASLLHIKKRDLPDTLRLVRALLNPEGVFYCSFKRGEFEGIRGARHFTDLVEDDLELLLGEAGFGDISLFITRDARPDRDEVWLNATARPKTS